MSDEKDRKDYQDYLGYKQYLASQQAQPQDGVSDVSPFESAVEKVAGVQRSIGKSVGGAIQGSFLEKPLTKLSEGVEKYASAPSRAAIGSLQSGDLGSDAAEYGPLTAGLKGGAGAVKAFTGQVGQDPKLAPSLEDIVEKSGIESPGGKAALEAALSFADVANFIPLERVAGPLLKGAGQIGGAGTAMGKDLVKAGASRLGEAAKSAVAKGGEMMTSIPAKAAKTYMERGPAVKSLIKSYGDDVAGAADEVRRKAMAGVAETRRQAGKGLEKGLESKSSVDGSSIIEKLEKQKTKLDVELHSDQINEINELITKTKAISGPDGGIPIDRAYALKGFLQDNASGSYSKGGSLVSVGNKTAQAAKGAAAETRSLIGDVSPDIRKADTTFSQLHKLDKQSPKGLLGEGLNHSALLEAGANMGSRNRKLLERIGKITGQDLVGSAEELSAMRSFADPKFYNPAASRSMAATGIGLATGGPVGAAIGGAITSPIAFKAAIDAGRIPVSVIKKIAGVSGELTASAVSSAFKAMQTPQGAQAFDALMKGSNIMREKQ